MTTITHGMIYGRGQVSGRDTPAATPAPAEAASGPDELADVGKGKYGPAIVVLSALGLLTAIRVAWELAEKATE